ncbi:hypothetical protein VTK73DRAFT_2282 [Phialemonium thermophilum]|uniref:ubiquitinyl hydrolase 1 n=1 Tax=Phialemonium thermophilum TaxID=223376 RepID=A0ABR3X5U0_9PEZI
MMNSDTRRILSRYDSYDSPEIYQAFYTFERPWDRLSHPAVLISLLVLALSVYHQLASQDGRLPSLPELVWDGLVRATPARLLYVADNWFYPKLVPMPPFQQQSWHHAQKSEVMSRILGVGERGGIMSTVSQARLRSLGSLSLSSAAGFKGVPWRPPGLGNMDNSCYQNSILQSLSALMPFRNYLESFDLPDVANRGITRTVDALRGLLSDLNHRSNSGKTLWSPVKLRSMSTWQQQDAQEYFSKLLDQVDAEAAKVIREVRAAASLDAADITRDESTASQHSDDSGYQSLTVHSKLGVDLKLARNPLEGLSAQRVACTACGYSEGLTMTQFNCLTLNLTTDDGVQDVYEHLDGYTKVESIPGVECAKCSLQSYRDALRILNENVLKKGGKEEDFPQMFQRFHTVETALEEEMFDERTLSEKVKIPAKHRICSTKTKQTVIARPPQSLAIHMNRSVFDERTFRIVKNFAAVRFPLVMDLGAWCLGSGVSPSSEDEKSLSFTVQPEEQWLLEPQTSMVAGSLGSCKMAGPIYELRAVITHKGLHNNGHYICYKKCPDPVWDKGTGWTDADSAGDPVAESTEIITGLAGENATPPTSRWWRMSDQNVSEVDEETVLAQGDVFMLFYDCIDRNMVTKSDPTRLEPPEDEAVAVRETTVAS